MLAGWVVTVSEQVVGPSVGGFDPIADYKLMT
jgi:hypothetical protein